MAQAVRDALAQWEPRVDRRGRRRRARPRRPGAGHASRSPTGCKATNDRRNLVYPFYVIPHEEELMALPAPEPRRPHLPGHRRRGQAADPALHPGVDQPQPVRPRRRAHRAVRLDERDGAVPGQPGAGPAVRALPQSGRHRAVPAVGRPAPTSRSGCPPSQDRAGRWCRPALQVTHRAEDRRRQRAASCSPPSSELVIAPAGAGGGA